MFICKFQLKSLRSLNHFRQQIEDEFTILSKRVCAFAKRRPTKDNHALIKQTEMDDVPTNFLEARDGNIRSASKLNVVSDPKRLRPGAAILKVTNSHSKLLSVIPCSNYM